MVNVHRELLRNLQHWHSLFESSEIPDTLVAANLQSYCLWDVDLFYAQRYRLPDRQRSSMELCLYQNVAERDAAVQMGIAETNPVSMYATVGISRLLGWAVRGELAGYRITIDRDSCSQNLIEEFCG